MAQSKAVVKVNPFDGVSSDVLRSIMFSDGILDRVAIVVLSFVCRRFRSLIELPKRISQWNKLYVTYSNTTFGCLVAGAGHLELLKWARRNGMKLTNCIWRVAARGNHIMVFQWLAENGLPLSRKLADALYTDAVTYGHKQFVICLRQKGIPWSGSECMTAAMYGHLGLLQWLIAAGASFDWRLCIGCATRTDQLTTLAWLQANKPFYVKI